MVDLDISDLKLELLLEHAPVALAVANASGRLILLSPAMEQILGKAFAPVKQDEWASTYGIYDPAGRQLLQPEEMPLGRALRGEAVVDAVLTMRRTSGDLAYLRCTASPLRDEQAGIIGAVALVQDVTAEHVAAQSAARLRDNLVEVINHEIRTPLTKILGYAELLGETPDDLPADVRVAASRILAAATDLYDLAKVISGLSDLEARSRVLLERFDLVPLLLDEVGLSDPQAEDACSGWTLDLPSSLVVSADRGQLQSAIRALIDNARAYAPAGAGLMLSASAEADWFVVAVEDAGEGIPESERDRLVEPFERGTDHEQLPGRGLGLAIAKTVAAAHGGELTIGDSQPLGGLKATLRLPANGPALPWMQRGEHVRRGGLGVGANRAGNPGQVHRSTRK